MAPINPNKSTNDYSTETDQTANSGTDTDTNAGTDQTTDTNAENTAGESSSENEQ